MEAEAGTLRRWLPRDRHARLRKRWRSGLPARVALIIAVVGPGNLANTIAEFAGVAAALEIFGVSLATCRQ